MCTLPICDNDDTIFIYYCTLSYYSTVEHPSLHYVSHHSPSRSGYSSVPYFSFLRLLCLSVCFPPTFTYTLKLLLLFLLWLFILIISIFLLFSHRNTRMSDIWIYDEMKIQSPLTLFSVYLFCNRQFLSQCYRFLFLPSRRSLLIILLAIMMVENQ